MKRVSLSEHSISFVISRNYQRSKMSKFLIILSVLAVSCLAQRSPYLRQPVGYPILEPTSTEGNLGNRFNDGQTTTTDRLPIEALGDRELVERLSRLPKDKQPFWLLNWRALEEHRKEGHTYQLRPNNFIDLTSQGQRPQNLH